LSASRGQGLSGPVQEHVVSGDHYSIIMGDGLPALAAIISDRLRQVTQISDARPVQPRAGSSMEPARRLRGGAPRYPTS
ncbi:MAG TPA: hypothetical protein VMV07_16440, partial [Streptosporangiaceae bacterium]|nr:hypothetical protein [Streptosporangiaceae bacterium]